ncbi:hypothetical protein F2Q69_00029766 [Brassica cretica]|uniref:Arabidopsis retrotransposon Orf1 C-terminal domain-containing protein n=1 Tax=Brassica cretica TaxID=69181 RepID=A0A8S9SBT8_BRACR|nr:hypothetical protein F2Q69_00029766 [Brassica cretica]
MPTNSHVLYPELVRQFMATVQVCYASERAKRASEGILTFFICGIRYIVPLSALSTIYWFQNTELQHAAILGFAGRSHFWEHLATGIFDSGSALQTDIRHPTLRYFMKVLANTLLCKMEPSLASIRFCPNPNLLRAPSTMPRYYTMQRLGGPQQGQSAAAFPPFPPMPDMSTRPEGDFQRVVVDSLTDIWARVSRCRCLRRRSV